VTSSLCDEFTCNRGTTEGDNHRAILACTPNATPPPTTLKTLHKNNNKQLVCLTSSIRRVSCRTQTTLFAIYSTRCGDKRCQQGSVVDAKSLIRSVVTNVIGGITCAVCTYNLYYDVVFIHTNYLDFFYIRNYFTRCNIRTSAFYHRLIFTHDGCCETSDGYRY